MHGTRYADALKIEALREWSWYGHSSGSQGQVLGLSTPLLYACIRLQGERQGLRTEIDALRTQLRELENELEHTRQERDILRNAHRVLSVTLDAKGRGSKPEFETRRAARARANSNAAMGGA